MKIFGYIINFMLILGIVIYLTIIGIQSTKPTIVSVELKEKTLKSSDLLDYAKNIEAIVSKEVDSKDITEEIEDESDSDSDLLSEENVSVNKEPTVYVSSSLEEDIYVSDVLETQVGSLSGYGPDCYGCSGILASGMDVRDGTIYYSDDTYGNVRILAGDSFYPYGTIVRVKNSRLPEFIGIVLDRGSAIGFGKSHLFDLLYASEALAYQNEVSYNTTFEILRYGY